jgi:hypothetical protein
MFAGLQGADLAQAEHLPFRHLGNGEAGVSPADVDRYDFAHGERP